MQPEPAADRSHLLLQRDHAGLLALWVLVAAVSPATDIVCHALTGTVPTWFPWARVVVMTVVFLMGAHSESARRLRTFCAVYAFWVATTTMLVALRGETLSQLLQRGFIPQMLLVEFQGVGAAFLVLAFAWSLRRRRDRLYLRIGELAAPLGPAWMRIAGAPLRWRLVGPVVGLVSALAVWEFVQFAGRPVRHSQEMALWAVLFAFMNAFVEESFFRNALLSSLEPAFDAQQRILVSAAIFGLGHWNGLPNGVAGVLMTSVLGYLAAKAMVETKGLFWPWFMHMLPDCVIFYYWGIGSVQHG